MKGERGRGRGGVRGREGKKGKEEEAEGRRKEINKEQNVTHETYNPTQHSTGQMFKMCAAGQPLTLVSYSIINTFSPAPFSKF
jgi:hypothetical protein